MLNAGFSTIGYLKSRLLPEESQEDTEWDAVLQALGKAVAVRFNNYCVRTLQRTVGVVEKFEARATGWVLTSYPVESLASVQVVTRDGAMMDLVDYTVANASGVFQCLTVPGGQLDSLVITYTGGYWLDPLDNTPMPDGATPLPDDILEAWVIQCQAHAEARTLFAEVSLRAGRKEDEKKATASLDLIPEVKSTLNRYVCFGGI